jgi:hypothetical protein
VANDRHRSTSYPYRPVPADLLKRVDETMGTGWRSMVISSLLARFLEGGPMPTPDEVTAEWDKPGQRHGG